MELQDPELQTEDFDSDTGSFSIEARIVRNSECCGDELKEATFNFEGQVPDETMNKHKGEGHDLSMECTVDPIEEGGGRYAKSFFGVSVCVEIECSCQKSGDEPVYTEVFDDKVAASAMEELC